MSILQVFLSRGLFITLEVVYAINCFMQFFSESDLKEFAQSSNCLTYMYLHGNDFVSVSVLFAL